MDGGDESYGFIAGFIAEFMLTVRAVFFSSDEVGWVIGR